MQKIDFPVTCKVWCHSCGQEIWTWNIFTTTGERLSVLSPSPRTGWGWFFTSFLFCDSGISKALQSASQTALKGPFKSECEPNVNRM